MTKTKIKRGDTKTKFSETLGVDLTGATVKFVMKGDGVLYSNSATITGASSGAVEYQLVATDVAIAGQYRQEWEVTYSDGKIQSFPVDDYNEVTIIGDLNA